MIGHEGVRRLLELSLKTHVPARLALIRAQMPPVPVADAPAVWPPDPHIMCADVLPDRSDWMPAVLIGSSDMTGLTASDGGTATEWLGTYTLDVDVAVVADRPGTNVLASVGRDRLVQAVIESMMIAPKLADGVGVVISGLTSQTGPVSEDLAARPMSGGRIPVTIRTVETLSDTRWPIVDATVDPNQTRPPGSPFTHEGETP